MRALRDMSATVWYEGGPAAADNVPGSQICQGTLYKAILVTRVLSIENLSGENQLEQFMEMKTLLPRSIQAITFT